MSESAKVLVCRIQDKEGRGPYKPGFSHKWSEREAGPLPVHLAFPRIREQMDMVRFFYKNGSFGCAFRTKDQAANWFSPSEVLTLASLGYALCWMYADEVLAENDDQLVFFSKKPFADAVIHRGWSVPEAA